MHFHNSFLINKIFTHSDHYIDFGFIAHFYSVKYCIEFLCGPLNYEKSVWQR